MERQSLEINNQLFKEDIDLEEEKEVEIDQIIEDLFDKIAKSSTGKLTKKKGKDLLDVLKFNRKNKE